MYMYVYNVNVYKILITSQVLLPIIFCKEDHWKQTCLNKTVFYVLASSPSFSKHSNTLISHWKHLICMQMKMITWKWFHIQELTVGECTSAQDLNAIMPFHMYLNKPAANSRFV